MMLHLLSILATPLEIENRVRIAIKLNTLVCCFTSKRSVRLTSYSSNIKASVSP